MKNLILKESQKKYEKSGNNSYIEVITFGDFDYEFERIGSKIFVNEPLGNICLLDDFLLGEDREDDIFDNEEKTYFLDVLKDNSKFCELLTKKEEAKKEENKNLNLLMSL